MTTRKKLWLGLMGLFTAAMVTNTPATAQQPSQKPNILFIMGDDIGWMQPSIYHVEPGHDNARQTTLEDQGA
jgi:hypothetical protein